MSALVRTGCVVVALAFVSPGVGAAEITPESATAALNKAVAYFREHCSNDGGYVFRVSADGKIRQGEEPVGPHTAWLQPPGTPAVGRAYLQAYQLTREPKLLDAAKETADALIRTQLVSGGWEDALEFDSAERPKHAFRADLGPNAKAGKLKNTTTFDDNKSQSAIQFLMQLDRELGFKDARLHEATLYALDAFVKAQFPNGAWPQRYGEFPAAAEHPVRKASFPESWPREFGGVKYSSFYTLNDGTISDVITSMLDAYDVYGDQRYLDAAKRGGDFLLLAQLPEPQPGWAQQYDDAMHPVWARKFEPPALTGSESQGVLRSLMQLYRRTADKKYLEPIPRALAYYRKCVLPDGQLARFYEIGTNKPLYFTKDYVLTYSDSDMPTHYAFKVSNKLDGLEAEFQKVSETPADKLWKPATVSAPKPSKTITQKAEAAISSLNNRGAWVEQGSIKTLDGKTVETEVIESDTFIKNLTALANYIASERPGQPR
jgi:hypothetical protein